MEIQCECGKFRAELIRFPENTPGRLKCYCDDCQTFMHYLNRADLLDENGGTEIIPFYPSDIRILSGKDRVKCVRLFPKGMFRFSTSCCNTPIANLSPKMPWAGIHRRMFVAKNADKLDDSLGPVKSSVMAKYAKGTLPPGSPEKFDLKGVAVVFPFLFKGMLLRKAKNSPFFENRHAIVEPKVLTEKERQVVRDRAGV